MLIVNLALFVATFAPAQPAFASAPASQLPQNIQARYDLCRTGLQGVKSNGPAKAVLVLSDTICFAGKIERASTDRLLELFQQVPSDVPIFFVGLSNGGEVGPALDVAEIILRRNVTFIAGPLCASSCANYFFLPASRRMIPENAIVAFHGGMSRGFIGGKERELRQELSKRRPEPEAVARIERTLEWARAAAPRQEAMLRAIGANPRFFELFDSFAVHPLSKFASDCRLAKGADMILLSDRLLTENGIRVQLNLGPSTAEDLHARLQALGLAGKICLWT